MKRWTPTPRAFRCFSGTRRAPLGRGWMDRSASSVFSLFSRRRRTPRRRIARRNQLRRARARRDARLGSVGRRTPRAPHRAGARTDRPRSGRASGNTGAIPVARRSSSVRYRSNGRAPPHRSRKRPAPRRALVAEEPGTGARVRRVASAPRGLIRPWRTRTDATALDLHPATLFVARRGRRAGGGRAKRAASQMTDDEHNDRVRKILSLVKSPMVRASNACARSQRCPATTVNHRRVIARQAGRPANRRRRFLDAARERQRTPACVQSEASTPPQTFSFSFFSHLTLPRPPLPASIS